MYFLYVDDSGSPDNPQQNCFVLGGLIIPEDKLFYAIKEADALARRILPAEQAKAEFHATDIFGGRTAPWSDIKDKRDRIGIIKKVLSIIIEQNITAIACVVSKEGFGKDEIVDIAFEEIISRFQIHLNNEYYRLNEGNKGKKIKARGTIIFDKSAYEKSIQRLAIKFRGEGTRYRDIKDILEVPLFVDSKASRCIQLADHLAYSVFRAYDARDLNYLDCVQEAFGEHGLCHKTKNKKACTCQSCLRQRYSNAPATVTTVSLPLLSDEG